jgi:hypothetical protein
MQRNLATPTLSAYFASHPAPVLGFRANGRSIYGIAGGAEDDAPADDAPSDDKPTTYSPPATQADLDRIIGERVVRVRNQFADYADLKAKAEAHDAALEAAKTDAEKAIDAARTEGQKSALEAVNARLVKSEARVLATAAKFRDPTDALVHLDLSDVKVGDDGEPDAKAIEQKLKTLAESKPYLIDDGKPTPRPDPTQGGGGGGEDKPSVSRGREMFENRRGAPKKTS